MQKDELLTCTKWLVLGPPDSSGTSKGSKNSGNLNQKLARRGKGEDAAIANQRQSNLNVNHVNELNHLGCELHSNCSALSVLHSESPNNRVCVSFKATHLEARVDTAQWID